MLNNPQHATQFEFLRSLGGRLRKSVPKLLLLREFGAQPLAYHWFKSAVRFWNKVAERSSSDPSDWLVLAMRENIEQSVSGVVPDHLKPVLWAHQFKKMLHLVAGPAFVLPGGFSTMSFDVGLPLPHVDVEQAAQAFHNYVFRPVLNVSDNPRLASSTEVMYCTYENWFASSSFHDLHAEAAADWCSAFHSVGGLNKSHLYSLLRFRLGAHDLRVATGRWEGRNGLPRPRRRCERCCQECVEDEYHLVFECDAYETLRDKWPSLFNCPSAANQVPSDLSPVGRSMSAFMNQDVHQVAAFIHNCFLTRALGVNPFDVAASEDSCASDCFLSAGSVGSLPASDLDDEFLTCSTDVSDVFPEVFSEPHEPLVGS